MSLAIDISERYAIAPANGYAGDVSPTNAWRMLEEIPAAVLIDVRTAAEWTYVGTPNVGTLGKAPIMIEWQTFPSMQIDAQFVAKLAQHVGADRDVPLLMLCRSGVRSAAAAKVMTAAGYGRCFNVVSGFEGTVDDAGHRGVQSGWKADGLPWSQK
ncbi:rhodanese-like domain-containing protein [Reyranella sp. CPCC 100927]|uniref:rhodanese-like domain-containing protein n=1 Tax=Reyranella sp. CPCC 100927 TaxID=2599616 RepID=UPI0011B779C3|nr:rhodanese-like domain-containing protein [Reyranella sp. CPCC 100927]TWT15503.1 rhodanese-like domain-containing protein [Reyranella sp. CPCC 100927]